MRLLSVPLLHELLRFIADRMHLCAVNHGDPRAKGPGDPSCIDDVEPTYEIIMLPPPRTVGNQDDDLR